MDLYRMGVRFGNPTGLQLQLGSTTEDEATALSGIRGHNTTRAGGKIFMSDEETGKLDRAHGWNKGHIANWDWVPEYRWKYL